MRVRFPPPRCRDDSVCPASETDYQRGEAGAEDGTPERDRLSRRAQLDTERNTNPPLTSEEGEPGFTFLGFRIRQYATGKHRSGKNSHGQRLGFKTYITPAKEAVRRHWLEVAKAIDSHKAVTQDELIRILNPLIRGWSNYYSTVCSSRR